MTGGTVSEGGAWRRLGLGALTVFRGAPRRDRRGTVMASFSRSALASIDIDFEMVLENHCHSPRRGTVRGFHYQLPPFGQAKLIRVLRGRILDVAVDLRHSAPSYGRHARAELTAGGWNQIYVPACFAHCYCTLEDDTEVLFKLDCEFAPDHARGLRWDDPDLAVDWPIAPAEAIILARDLERPRFRELDEAFP
jgi:dTDP-4-dehydrorhamnose 3,5-epimerase